MSPPLVPLISWINPVHTLTVYSFKIIFTLSFHLLLVLINFLFSSGIETKILHAFISLSLRSLLYVLQSHPPLFHHSDYIWRGFEIMEFPIMHSYAALCYFLLGLDIMLSVLFSNSPNIYSSLIHEKNINA
jgi:hypothetical protein